jgi:hypothetical protein
MKEVENPKGASREAEDRCGQRDDPVYGLEHEIEEQRQNNIEPVPDSIHDVAIHNQLSASKELGQYRG